MNKERNYGIDLLRLVLMYMVCILHTLGQGGVLAASVQNPSGNKVFWLLEIIAYCAVDGFALISGYMASNKPRKYEKLVDMWFQAFFYAFIITLLFAIIGKYEWPQADIIRCIFPVTYSKFWYFTAFFGLFFAIPILNKFIFSVDEKTAKKALIILGFLFSIMGILGDPFTSSGGYSMIWLIVLYCIGALARKIKLFETQKSLTLIIIWALCILVTWIGHSWFGIDILINYISPTILLSGMIMVVLFSRIHLKGTIISKLSPLAFGIYLFQLNQVIWSNIIQGAFVSIASKNIIIGVLLVLASAFLIFISGMIVEFARSKLAKALKISSLSKKIVNTFDALIQKMFIFMK